MFGSRSSALRVKVKKCEGSNPVEYRKFSVDPQITSLEVLYSLLAKAFELNQDFGISYKTTNPQTNADQLLIILSDWDLEAAFLRFVPLLLFCLVFISFIIEI
jgi:TBC1 domain family member 25